MATCLHHLSSTSTTVILLTADPTLSNVALANGIRVATAATIRLRLLGEDAKEPAPAVVRETEEMVALARTALRELLEAVLVAELQEVHGAQLWRQVVGLGAEDRWVIHRVRPLTPGYPGRRTGSWGRWPGSSSGTTPPPSCPPSPAPPPGSAGWWPGWPSSRAPGAPW